MCEFGVSQALIYYTHLPVLLLSGLLAIFIYISNKKNPINRNLCIFILFFFFWTANDLATWLVSDPALNLFFTRIAILEELSIVFFLIMTLYFVGEKVSFKKKVLLFLPLLPVIAFLFTDHNARLVGGDLCNVQFGNLYWYLYVLALGYFGYAVYRMLRVYWSPLSSEALKNQIEIIIFAAIFFVVWFVVISVLASIFVARGASVGDTVLLYLPFGFLMFIGMMAYAITKYQFLNTKTITAQMLTYTIWILIGTQFFFANTLISVMIVMFTLFLSVIFGTMLINAMKVELQQKKELEIANAKLRELDETKSEFISMASHQLRTPLTSMKGFVGLMKSGTYGKVPKSFEEPLSYIENANDRLIMLVEDMLNVSRIELGQMHLDLKKHNINDLITELYQSFTVLAHKKGLDLYVRQSPHKLFVKIDYNAMREAVSNIIDNAIKYTTKGSVTIETREENGRVLLSIIDTGIGISEKEFIALFDKFVRGKRAQQVKKGGAGLGLYIGRKIIESHHGKIYARSDGQGKGTAFIIELPVAKK